MLIHKDLKSADLFGVNYTLASVVLVCGKITVASHDSIGNESAPIYNWHSAGSLGWPFPTLDIFLFQIREQFYQTALGNCYCLKLPKC